MLKVIDLEKNYGPLKVLKQVSLEVLEGEVVSVVGASGAGKSTLLQILGTLDTPDAGEVMLKGKKYTALKGDEMARFRNREIGFVFQFHNLLPEFTAFENICLPGYIGKKPIAEVEHRATELMALLGISSRKMHKPSELSGGEQQRTAVARALVNSPAIVFADEPSGNLDSRNADDLHRLFFRLRKELGQSFVIVTHNSEFAQMADRVIEIQDGYIKGAVRKQQN